MFFFRRNKKESDFEGLKTEITRDLKSCMQKKGLEVSEININLDAGNVNISLNIMENVWEKQKL